MKNNSIVKRSLICFMAVLIMLSSLTLSTQAYEDLDKNYDIVDCAEQLKSDFYKSLSENIVEVKDNTLEKNYQATLAYDTIINYIDENENDLRMHFSGAQITTDGSLEVSLSCADCQCIDTIVEILDFDDVVFVSGVGSYYYGQQQLEEINERIAYLQNTASKSVNVDKNVSSLMSTYPRTRYNCEDNTVSIIFNVSSEVELAVNQVLDSNMNTSKSNLNNTNSLLTQYYDIIDDFEMLVVDSSSIKYEVCSNYEQAVDDAEAWRPGREIFVYTNPTAGSGSLLSTGYRAQYTYNGTTYYGFVTAGHGTEVGRSVYLNTSISSTNKIGVILNRAYGGTLDVSFINMTNSNFTNSNVIYYTSSQSGVTRPGTILDGTQTTVALNSNVYKSGRTTYLTSGYITELDTSYYINGVYFYDLFRAGTEMNGSGDSGAVSYIVGTGAVSGKAVGIIKGRYESRSVFVRASNIRDAFGASAY